MERNRGKKSLGERIKSDGSRSFQLSSFFFFFIADSGVLLVVWCEHQGP